MNPRTQLEKPEFDRLHSAILDPLPFECLCQWKTIAEEYGKLTDEQKETLDCVRIPISFPDVVKRFSDQLLKDRDDATGHQKGDAT